MDICSRIGGDYWVVGAYDFVQEWMGNGYSLPVLNSNCKVIHYLTPSPASHFSTESWTPLCFEGSTWYVNSNRFQLLEGDWPFVYFKDNRAVGPSRKNSIRDVPLELNIERLRALGPCDGAYSYIELALYDDGSLPPVQVLRINQSPTLYLSLVVSEFARRVGHEIVLQHPEASKIRDDENQFVTWIDRNKDYGPCLYGRLLRSVGRVVRRLISAGEAPMVATHVARDFRDWFSALAEDSVLNHGFHGSDLISEKGRLKYLLTWSFHAAELLYLKPILFEDDLVAESASEAWLLATGQLGEDCSSSQNGRFSDLGSYRSKDEKLMLEIMQRNDQGRIALPDGQ